MLTTEFPPSEGRVVRRSHLIRLGYTPSLIRAGCREGTITRVRHGWYAHPDADPGTVAAVRAHTVVSCVSALSHHGVWGPAWFARNTLPVHARRSEHAERAARLPESGVILCRGVERNARPCPTAIDGIDDALITAASCQPSDWLTVLIDSIRHRRLRALADLESLDRRLEGRLHRAIRRSTGQAESGTETLTGLGLRRRNIPFEQQVWIGRRRVDFLIGDRLIIEVDGAEFHNRQGAFEADRRRDRELMAAGYFVVRLTYWQVLSGLDEALDDICRIMARGIHRG